MRKINTFAPRLVLLLAVSFTFLTACSDKLEDPEMVMTKAKQALVDLQSGQVMTDITMEGVNGTEELSLTSGIEVSFDNSDTENMKVDLHVNASGSAKFEEKLLEGDLDFSFIGLDKQYYIKLTKLESNDETLTAMKPFIDMYSGKWLRIAEDFIPEDIRDLQGQDEEVKRKQQQLQELFVKTELFTVTKEYSVEKLDGEKVYHYGVSVNPDGFRDYVTKAAIIDGRELTTQEIDEALAILDYFDEAELYISTDNYYVLKSVLRFSGKASAEEDSGDLNLEVVVEGSDFNKSVDINAPADAEDFNPLNLLMGFGGVPTMTTEDGAMEGDLMMEEGTSSENSLDEGAVMEEDESAITE